MILVLTIHNVTLVCIAMKEGDVSKRKMKVIVVHLMKNVVVMVFAYFKLLYLLMVCA